MNRDYDIIVVGAGPGGSTAALHARRAGMRVLLMDKKCFPRDKICGDAVSRMSIEHLKELGLHRAVRAAIHAPITCVKVFAPNGRSLRISLGSDDAPSPHVVCRRLIFDNILVDAAKQEMEVLERCAATGLLTENGKVCGVIYRRRDGTQARFTANVVVGADGFNSVVARKMGIYKHRPDRRYVATRTYYRGLGLPVNTVEIHYINQTLPGFLWFFPTGDDVVNVGLGIVHEDLEKRHYNLRDLHETVLRSARFASRFKNAERIGSVSGWHLPTADPGRRIHGGGFMLTGDAAGLADPFTGEGIGNAMCSGKIAAETAAKACSTEDYGAAVLGEYPIRLWKELDADEINLHYRIRDLARHRSLINFIARRAAARPDVLRWISSMIGDPDSRSHKRELVSPKTYLKLLIRSK